MGGQRRGKGDGNSMVIIVNDFLAWKRDRSLPPRFLVSMIAMVGLVLNPTGLPSEHPTLRDPQSSAQGGHTTGRVVRRMLPPWRG